MLFLRRLFFYLLIGIYLVFCPLIISHALGYMFQQGEAQGIVKSGLIAFSTHPSGASIYLGHRRYTRKTPTILPGLLPGEYPVTVLLKGYRPWFETLPVEAGKATVLDRILLLPEEWKPKELLSGPFENLLPMPGSRWFLLTKGEMVNDLWLYDWRGEKTRPLLQQASIFSEAKVLSYHHVPESSAFILHVGARDGEKFIWIVPSSKENRLKNVTSLVTERPHYIEWDPRDKKHLFAFQGGYLNMMDLVSGAVVPGWLDGARGIGIFDKKLYMLRDNYVFERMDFDGKKEKLLLEDSSLGHSVFGEKGTYRIRIFSEDVILFLGEKGELIANRFPYRFVPEGVLGLEFYLKGKRLLVWKKDALGILDFSKVREEEEGFESGPELTWVYQQGGKIEQAFWVYEGSDILFRDRDGVFLLGLQTYGKPHVHHVLEVKPKTSIFYVEESGKLYYLDGTHGSLSAIDILPGWTHLTLPLLERRETNTKKEPARYDI